MMSPAFPAHLPYTVHYQPQLHPGRQALALALAGRQSPDFARSFTHLELGCGFGLSALIHAAAHPKARFFAVDALPAHVGWAQGMAEAAALTNLTVIGAPFGALHDQDLPACDTIALHGVWSWVSDADRAHALRLIDQLLKPGGVLYLSYNALPGLAALLPLREMMRLGFDRATGDAPARIAAALTLVDVLDGAEARYLRDNPAAAALARSLARQHANYAAHEYFAADWRCFYHREVAAALAPLGLSFAASTDLADALPETLHTAAGRAVLAAETDPTARETLADVLLNRDFRADLFIRAPAAAPDAPRDFADRIGPIALTLGAHELDHIVLRTPAGPRAPDAVTRAVMAALVGAPADVTRLRAKPELCAEAPETLARALVWLMAAGAADPALPVADDGDRRARCARLNAALWAQAPISADVGVAASPLTGAAISATQEEQIFLLARLRNLDPVDFASGFAPDTARADIAADHGRFVRDRLPVLERHGVA
ncbi:MAG: class I SAM-dependent methyltransferase [Rhodospirillaceae bacterium]|nr:class I SAM-dependent methyltransferase [Rhodospirillaceae bacterium]